MIKLKRENMVFYALAGLMLSGTIINLLNVFIKLFFNSTFTYVEKIIDIIGIILFVLFIPELLRKAYRFVIITLVSFSLLWIGAGLIFPENIPYLIENSKQFFIYVLPFSWIAVYLTRNQDFISVFLKIGKTKFVIALITQIVIFIFPKTDIFDGDYMDASNAMLVGIMSVFYLAYKDRKMVDIILSICGIFITLISGSRNVLVAIIVFWILVFIQMNRRKKFIWLTGILFFGCLLLIFYRPILELVSKIATDIGFSAHLIDALLTNSVFEDSTRLKLFEGFWQAILERPFFGYGVLGDRAISIPKGIWHKPMYPHNIILELFIDFGMLFGSLIITWYAIKIIQGFKSKNEKYKGAVFVLFCCSIVKLMVSSTVWNDQMFFMLSGFLLSYSFQKKRSLVVSN